MDAFGGSPLLTGKRARVAYGALALMLLAAIVFLVREKDVSVWYAVVFAAAPDLALIAGIAPGLERGQLHPRAVPLYNAVHSLVGPLVLGIASAVWLGLPWLAAALASGLHVAVDRAVGYGPRTAAGFQRD